MTTLSLQTIVDHPRLVPALIVAVSLGALAAALASQYWGGLQPCVLCYYQRYAYLVAAAFGLLGLVGLAFLTGAAIAAFHVGVEQQWWRGTSECHAPAFDPNASIAALRERLLETDFVPCDVVPWSLFGISMAGYNVLASLGLALASFWAARNIARIQRDLTPEAEVARIIRVDHAGEYGARRIYEGQLAVLGRNAGKGSIRRMYDQELEHLDRFEKLMVARRVRPTALQPLWHVAGFALGAATAMIGERAAMACTVAIEEVIDEHYGGQLDRLGPEEAELKGAIETFQADEREHRDTALDHGAAQAPGYEVLRGAIKSGSRLAIWLSERI
jgi:ubiquinone biosynthesis monooxygenase Coq7